MDLLQVTESGIYCAAGDFHIDPWRPVSYAVTTHAHSDHARIGSKLYLTSARGKGVLQERLGSGARIEALPFGEKVTRNGVTVSLHPAGHILGSAQVRVEHRGEVWVVSGDYKTEVEPTCDPFEPVKCHTFITESTFGLPLYRWRPQTETFAGINEWWRGNQSAERASVLYAYSLGKAQRVMAGVDASLGPVFVHGSVAKLLPHYQNAGVKLPDTRRVEADTERSDLRRCLVIAPSSVEGTPWLRRFGEISTAFASGWMRIRGARRRQALDRGFEMSDHADWDGLISSIRATGAARILVTHGYMEPMVRWLRENGWQADPLATRFTGETASGEVPDESGDNPATTA
jgi:putative mRNA 3-end processing factor